MYDDMPSVLGNVFHHTHSFNPSPSFVDKVQRYDHQPKTFEDRKCKQYYMNRSKIDVEMGH